MIFRGKGLRIKPDERKAWDKRVRVYFQPNAWCDEEIMKTWINNDWGSVFFNPPTPGSDGKILIADVHRAQQTETVKRYLSRCKTELVNVPPGLTPYVQILDVVVNKPFKNDIKRQSEKHMEENLEKYTEGKLTASERRVLITKWCGEAWSNLDKDVIVRGFAD